MMAALQLPLSNLMLHSLCLILPNNSNSAAIFYCMKLMRHYSWWLLHFHHWSESFGITRKEFIIFIYLWR